MEIRRPSIIFAISSILGILLAYNKILIIDKIIILSIIFIAGFLIWQRKYLKVYAYAAFLICAILFALRFKTVESRFDNINKILDERANKNVSFNGTIDSIGNSTNSKYIDLSGIRFYKEDIGLVRCYYSDDLNFDPKIGERVNVSGKVFLFEKAKNLGEFDSENYYRSMGLSASMYIKDIKKTDGKFNIILQTLYDIKKIIREKINLIFTPENAGIFNCMITGDKSGISKDKRKMYQENGIAHILAISGLHLSILGLGLFEILRRKLRLKTSAFIVSLFIFLYGLFIDSGVSSMRAIIMLYVRFLGLSIGRSYDSKNTLYILLTIFLFVNPYNLFNVGFNFSYMAVFSLTTEYKISERVKIPSVVVLTLFLLPITVYNYFTYPIYSIFLNLIVIPLMTLVLLFGLIGLGCSFISITLGRFMVGIVNFILLLYEKLCNLVEVLPFHKVIWGKPSFKSVIFFYLTLLMIYIIFIKLRKIKDKKRYMLISLSVVLIIISTFSLTIIKKPDFRITCLSVGQGDSFIIENNGKCFTIDGGSSSNKRNGEYIIAPHMLSLRENVIEKAYISHIDADHMNGIRDIIENNEDITVKEIVLPFLAKDNVKYKDLINLSKRKGVRVSYLERGENDKIDDDLNFYCLNPSKNSSKEIKEDVNAHSMCLKLEYKDFSMLFTGDMSKDSEFELLKDKRTKDRLKSDVLKVAHHGSKTSSIQDFLWKVDPKVAIISYGYKNSYGHPHEITLQKLSNSNIKIYDTVNNGEIDIEYQKNPKFYTFFDGK